MKHFETLYKEMSYVVNFDSSFTSVNLSLTVV